MSYGPQSPYPQNPYQGAGFRPRESNGMGVAGLIISIIGLLVTCGLLCPVGLLFSLIGLTKQPRGEAIAGTIIGGLGTLAIVSVFGFFFLAFATAGKAVQVAANQAATEAEILQAEVEIDEFRLQNGSLPGGIEGNKMIIHHTDAWGNSLRYDLEDDQETYTIRSAGPDLKFDTPDDITQASLYGEFIDDSPSDMDFDYEVVPAEELDFDIDQE